jgi:hypothetical protein
MIGLEKMVQIGYKNRLSATAAFLAHSPLPPRRPIFVPNVQHLQSSTKRNPWTHRSANHARQPCCSEGTKHPPCIAQFHSL